MKTIIAELFATAPKEFTDKLVMSGDCVIWTGAQSPKGYGAFKYAKKTHRAHRLAYWWHYGHLDPKSILMHRCDTPACVNPTHLREGTRLENNHDMRDKGRSQHGSTHTFAKLTEQKVAEARRRHRSGATLEPMAREYGVSLPTLWYAVVGKTWKHVQDEAYGA